MHYVTMKYGAKKANFLPHVYRKQLEKHYRIKVAKDSSLLEMHIYIFRLSVLSGSYRNDH